MLEIGVAWLVSIFLFAALIVYIAKYPQKRTKPLKLIFILMFLGGMLIYCYCHYQYVKQIVYNQTEVKDNYLAWVKDKNAPLFYVPYVIVRSVIDVGIMFYGRPNGDIFFKLPIAKNPGAVFIFWLFNLVAFYITAAALLLRFGNDLLRWIRIMTSKISDIDLIFGVNSNSVALSQNIVHKNSNMLVYVDNIFSEDYETTIRELGGLIYSDKDALRATNSFLKKIRIKPGKTKLKLYALSQDCDKNLQYSRILSESLKNAGISPEQTELVLLGTDEWKGMIFQASEKKYGYGNVVCLDEFELCSRFLIYKYPLCNIINFDKNARAVEDINVLIVGFGRIGHEVLRKVIANGQFEGSRFHATIYDPNFENRTGFIKSQYPNIFANYEIDFEPQGGRSNKFFKFLQENAKKLNYIVVCIDDREIARDIAIHMVDRMQALGFSKNVYTCDTQSIRCYSPYADECETHWIYDSELLCSDELDKYAMEINHRYAGGKDIKEDWKKCDYFSRMNNRASVDYLIPLIKKINAAALTHTQRENLAKSEHLRWCAFQYTFGFDVMEKEDFINRIKDRLNEIKEHGYSSIKTTKDMKNLKHACLVDWKKLDEISKIENSLTHENKNYKDLDRHNVDMIMKLVNDVAKGKFSDEK